MTFYVFRHVSLLLFNSVTVSVSFTLFMLLDKLKLRVSSSSCNLQRTLEPIAKMNLCVWFARMPMKATGFAVGVFRARP